jgi:uncharacterized protein
LQRLIDFTRDGFSNALSGTVAYAKSNRIDYRSGIIFSLATAPGAILGALATTGISRAKFDLSFGLLMLCVAVYLTLNPGKKTAGQLAQRTVETQGFFALRKTTLLVGAALSTAFGFISSSLGIGGGFLYVPALVYFLGFPVHIATATSLFVFTITAFTGSATHFAAGLFHEGIRRAMGLSVGAVIGAQIGAKLSDRIHGGWIMRSLAVALGLLGIRLLALSLC